MALRTGLRSGIASSSAEQDRYVAELQKDLSRRGANRACWGVIWTAFIGFLTFGLAPAILWSLRLREQAEADRDVYSRAADWLRFHSVHPEAGRLRAAAERMSGQGALSLLPIVCCLGVVLFFFATVERHHDRMGEAQRATHQYPVAERFRDLRERGIDSLQNDFNRRDKLFLAWAGGLSLAYLTLWLAVRSHTASVQRFGNAFQAFSAAEGIRGAPRKTLATEPVARWWIGALVLPAMGLAWGPAAMLAGAARRRFAVVTSAPLRKDVTFAIGEMIRLRVGMGTDAAQTMRCPRSSCSALLPGGARFCRRCGAATHQ